MILFFGKKHFLITSHHFSINQPMQYSIFGLGVDFRTILNIRAAKFGQVFEIVSFVSTLRLTSVAMAIQWHSVNIVHLCVLLWMFDAVQYTRFDKLSKTNWPNKSDSRNQLLAECENTKSNCQSCEIVCISYNSSNHIHSPEFYVFEFSFAIKIDCLESKVTILPQSRSSAKGSNPKVQIKDF